MKYQERPGLLQQTLSDYKSSDQLKCKMLFHCILHYKCYTKQENTFRFEDFVSH